MHIRAWFYACKNAQMSFRAHLYIHLCTRHLHLRAWPHRQTDRQTEKWLDQKKLLLGWVFTSGFLFVCCLYHYYFLIYFLLEWVLTSDVCVWLQIVQTWHRYAAIHAYKKSQTLHMVEEAREHLNVCTYLTQCCNVSHLCAGLYFTWVLLQSRSLVVHVSLQRLFISHLSLVRISLPYLYVSVIASPHLLTHPLAVRVIRAPTDDFTINFLLFFSVLHCPLRHGVHSLMLFSQLILSALSSFPFHCALARWFWPDLMNGRHVHTTAVCVSLWWSGGLSVVRLLAWSWHRLPRW